MLVKRLREYHWFLWLVSAAFAYWTYRYCWLTTPDGQDVDGFLSAIWLHELGHVVFGFGGFQGHAFAIPNINWIGSQLGGFLLPILLFTLLGRIARKWFPPVWVLGGIAAEILQGITLHSSSDYPRGSILHYSILVVIALFCIYNLFKPARASRLWNKVKARILAESGIEARMGTCRTQSTRPPITSRIKATTPRPPISHQA